MAVLSFSCFSHYYVTELLLLIFLFYIIYNFQNAFQRYVTCLIHTHNDKDMDNFTNWKVNSGPPCISSIWINASIYLNLKRGIIDVIILDKISMALNCAISVFFSEKRNTVLPSTELLIHIYYECLIEFLILSFVFPFRDLFRKFYITI